MVPIKMRLLLLINVVTAVSACHICGPIGNSGLKYPNGYVEQEKASCMEIVMKVFKKRVPQAECNRLQKLHEICCNGTKLSKAASNPSNKKPVRVKYIGPHPKCHVCAGGSYPSDPSHIIHLLYIGASSCRNYYVAGREGKIPSYLCDPLRYFAQSPCGCKTKSRSVTKPTNLLTNKLGISALSIEALTLMLLMLTLYLKYKRKLAPD